MKKEYESPKAEKLDFTYTNTVAASFTPDEPPVPTNHGVHIEYYWSGNQSTPNRCVTPCTKQWKWVANC